jgi:amino acid adenylation domain-containing protein
VTEPDELFAFPASSAQERLLFLDEANPGLPAYNEAIAFRLRGRLELRALQAALDALLERHEALRTTLEAPGGVSRQVVHPVRPWPLHQEGWTDLQSAGEESEVISAWLNRISGAPYDLQQGPLVRAALLTVAPDDHVFLLGAHHSICDGVSLDLLTGEIARAYGPLLRGESHGLPEVEVQYPDFTLWQREQSPANDAGGSLAYWQERLAGLELPLTLPTDRPRPAVQAFLGGHVLVRMPPEEVAAVDALARAERTTRFTILLTGYVALLARLSRQADIAIGVPVANRDAEGTDVAIGFYANVLVYRTAVSLERPFIELVHAVRQMAEDALTHRNVPFDHVVDALHPTRSLAHNPLFQVMFSLADDPETGFQLEGLSAERLPVDSGGSRVDQWFNLLQGDKGVALHIEYDGALFDRATAEGMGFQFRRLLQDAAAAQDRPVERLALLSPSERDCLTDTWANSTTQIPRPATLPAAVALMAVAHPDAIAVEELADGRTLTYAALEDRVVLVADTLQRRGIGPGDVVAVLLDRNAWLPATLLGVLRARAAYLPLDTSLPEARMRYMLEASGARGIISTAALGGRLSGSDLLLLDVSELPTAPDGPGPDAVAVQADDLAYIIFTSGSTGQPKGVEVTHGALANFLGSMAVEPGMAAGDRVLALTTVTFDIAGLELFLPLTTGGTIVLADRDSVRDGRALVKALADRAISALQATPATWRLLLDGGWTGTPHLKALVGGEALAPDLARALIGKVGELWNVYGPTETTIWSTLHRVMPDDPYVSIGRPIANTNVYVVDEHGEPTPVGVPGEILIGGLGVARGYRGRPDLTAERFVADPVGRSSAIVYRTGDLGRWRADGRLEHLGRRDDQVKIRGFRVELGDVEAALSAHPDLQGTAVTVRPDPTGQSTLVAYLVPRDGASLTSTDARRFLRQALPEYMVPSQFVMLDRLPLTPSGKVDRRALPDPFGGARPARAHRSPTQPMELLIAELWREVIGDVQPGLDDNFFDLGGHSLGAMRMLARLEERGGPRLRVWKVVRENLEHLAAEAAASGN